MQMSGDPIPNGRNDSPRKTQVHHEHSTMKRLHILIFTDNTINLFLLKERKKLTLPPHPKLGTNDGPISPNHLSLKVTLNP